MGVLDHTPYGFTALVGIFIPSGFGKNFIRQEKNADSMRPKATMSHTEIMQACVECLTECTNEAFHMSHRDRNTALDVARELRLNPALVPRFVIDKAEFYIVTEPREDGAWIFEFMDEGTYTVKGIQPPSLAEITRARNNKGRRRSFSY